MPTGPVADPYIIRVDAYLLVPESAFKQEVALTLFEGSVDLAALRYIPPLWESGHGIECALSHGEEASGVKCVIRVLGDEAPGMVPQLEGARCIHITTRFSCIPQKLLPQAERRYREFILRVFDATRAYWGIADVEDRAGKMHPSKPRPFIPWIQLLSGPFESPTPPRLRFWVRTEKRPWGGYVLTTRPHLLRPPGSDGGVNSLGRSVSLFSPSERGPRLVEREALVVVGIHEDEVSKEQAAQLRSSGAELVSAHPAEDHSARDRTYFGKVIGRMPAPPGEDFLVRITFEEAEAAHHDMLGRLRAAGIQAEPRFFILYPVPTIR